MKRGPYALFVCVCILASALTLGGESKGQPELILENADLHFTTQGVETVPSGSAHIGASVRVLAHVALDGNQTWTKRGVVLDIGGNAEESAGVSAPSVLYDNGTYKMWYAGHDGVFPHGWILYADSPDGIAWTKRGVVLSPGPVGESANVHYPSVMNDSGVFRMWYTGYDGSYYRIFYATSSDGLAWNRQGLVVDRGAPGSYDSLYAYRPFVMLDGVYKMWYSGFDGTNGRILYATSTDGLSWVRQGLALDIGPPGALDDNSVYWSAVLREGGGYQMWYTGGDSTTNRLFYATSLDGVAWVKRGLVLDVGGPGSPDTSVSLPSVIYSGAAIYKLWYAGRSGVTTTDRILYANLTAFPLPAIVNVAYYLDFVQPANLIGTAIAQVGTVTEAVYGINWTANSLGLHRIYAVIDPSNAEAETNEANNVASVTIMVNNDPPIADAGPDQNVFRNQITMFDGTGSSDPDGDPLSFVWSQTSGIPLLVFNANTSTPIVFPYLSGLYTFTLTVLDPWGGFSTDSVNITVTNRAPVADAGPDFSVAKGANVQLDGGGSADPDGDMLTYSWIQTGGTTVALFNPDTATPVFLPAASGVFTFELTVNDGDGGTDTDSVQVAATNAGPVADADADFSAFKHAVVMLNGTGSSDADGDALSYSWTQAGGPSVTLSGSDSTKPTFVPNVAGVYKFTLIVDDGDGGVDTDTVNVTVANRIPTADAGADSIVAKRGLVVLDGRGSLDPDSDGLSYSWTQIGGPAVALQAADTPTPSFSPTAHGFCMFNLTVDDGDGGTSFDTVQITVSNANPTANAGPPQSVRKNTIVTLDASGSSDPDGDPLQFAWTQTGGPSVSLTDSDGVTAWFLADMVGTYTFEISVDDGDGGTDSDTVQAVVWSMAPVAVITTNATVTLMGNVLYFDGKLSSDPDGTIVDYAFDFGGGSQVNGTARGRSHSFSTAGSHTVTLTVTDNDGNKSSVSMIVSVNPPPPPRDILADIWWLLIVIVVLVVIVAFLAFERRKWKKKAQVVTAAALDEGGASTKERVTLETDEIGEGDAEEELGDESPP